MQAPTDTTVARIKCSHTRHDALDVDLELDIKDADVARVCKTSFQDVVECLGVVVIVLAAVGSVLAVFALLMGCCRS